MFAPKEIREKIIEALRDEDRRFMVRDDKTSRGYLDKYALTESGLCEDLADELEKCELELKPKSQPHQAQKYRYVIPYPEFEDIPAVELHITLSPRGEPIRVRIEVHPSNTGYQPIKRVPIKKK